MAVSYTHLDVYKRQRQFRYALQQPLLEIPAGKLDPNEEPINCAKRELAEETGYRAKEWISLGTIATSPGFCNEVLHLYLAKDLTMGETHWDPDEYVELCLLYTSATQSNIIRNQKELMLYKIQTRRNTFSTELEIINEELKKNEIDFCVELNKLKEQIHGK